jgi:hypothetical protein
MDNFRRHLYPVWDTERQIVIYANGGPPPSDGDTCENDVVPLGFAPTMMKKEMAPLLDALELEPGVISMTCCTPIIPDFDRTQMVEMELNKAVNDVVMGRLKPVLTSAAGRSTVTGRACLYWTSRHDWVPKFGRLIHPPEAGVDILDGSWREWAFDGKITLEQIEERLKGSVKNGYGWNHDGLMVLKEWIIASEAEKYASGTDTSRQWLRTYDREIWRSVDISNTSFAEPVDVYWYYKKNGKITKNDPLYGGHEKVDLYCVSRFGSSCKVEKTVRDEITYRKLTVQYPNTGKNYLEKLMSDGASLRDLPKDDSYDAQNERLLFYLPDAFDSIEEALVFHNDDASVSGDQLMSEVRGVGKTAMPKLAVMEAMYTNMIEGLGFASAVTWSVAAGVSEEYLEQLQQGGLRSGQAFPAGIQPMAKQNSLTGFGAMAQAIQMMDQGIAADSQANQQGTLGSNKADFASQAQAQLTQRQFIANLRGKNWLCTLDKVVRVIARRLCLHWPDQRTAYPCYYDAQRMMLNLQARYQIHPDEWDVDRWEIQARRLAGGMMRQEAIQVNTMLIQVVGPIMPSLLPIFAKEILRAYFGDTKAQTLTMGEKKGQETQMLAAQMNCASALANGVPPPVKPMDDPIVHSGWAAKLANDRTKAAMMTGTVTTSEVVGVKAVIAYSIAHLMRLPQQLADPAMQQLEAISVALSRIPVQAPPQEGAMTEKEQVDAQLKAQNYARLERESAEKLRLKQNEELLKMRQLGNAERSMEEQNKSLAVQRAKLYQDMTLQLNEADALQTDPADDPFATLGLS